jgi:homoserine kinase
LEVRVPASTSNLGPGFDQLGVALDLFLDLRWTPGEPGRLTLEAPPDWPEPSEDRLLACLRQAAGSALGGHLRVHSEIPIGRGIGSSGAATAAGLLLGAALRGDLDPDREALLLVGLTAEGHPDNIGAALLGGAVASCPTEDGGLLLTRPRIHQDIEFALAWPDTPLFTPAARQVLPRNLPLADAVFNARRLTLLLAGLESGRGDWLHAGLQDRWHVPYRLPLLPGSARAMEAAHAQGAFGATLSGAGSALLALCPAGSGARVAEAMAEELRRATGSGTARLVQEAPRVRVLFP